MRKYFAIPLVVVSLFGCNLNKTSEGSDPVSALDPADMDLSVDPCVNFYDYAIGNWREANPVPESEGSWYAMNILNEENKAKLLNIVKELVSDPALEPGSNEDKIRKYFLSGLDTTKRNEEHLNGLSGLLAEVDAADRHEDILHLFGELAPLGVRTPISFFIGADRKNSTMNAVYAYQSGINLPDRDYYLLDNDRFKTTRQAYVEHVDRLMGMCGYAPSGSRILAIETTLAKHFWTREENRVAEKTYNLMATSEWFSRMDKINPEHVLAMRGFKPVDTIIVYQPSYFEALNKEFRTIPVEDWKAYLTYNLIHAYAGVLSLPLEKENFTFYSGVLRGTEQMKPLDERVYAQVNGGLGEAIGKLFVAEYFPAESKQYMSELIENLRSAYKESILELTWMSEKTKEMALKKLAAFTYKIGYPDEWEDYSSLEIEDSYVQNTMNARLFGHRLMLDKQDQPVDRTKWGMTPQMVNAYYNASNNEIVFPAGILQPPFFHKDFDHAVNYGGIGAVIGHEFSHGFDDNGSKFDWDGNLNDWWTAEDRKKFEALAAQLGAQYDAYMPIDSMYVNGRLTMGENIADLGGITLAYAACQKAIGENVPEKINGFTWQQRFFLAWANVWKGNIKEETLVNRLKSDPHSPAEYRVIGPLVNFKPYEEAFGVCESAPMHKPDSAKIKIW